MNNPSAKDSPSMTNATSVVSLAALLLPSHIQVPHIHWQGGTSCDFGDTSVHAVIFATKIVFIGFLL